MYAVNPSGSQKWKFKAGQLIDCSPAIGADGTVYFASYDNYIYAVNPDGTEKWKFETGNSIESSPSIGADGTIYIGSGDTYLYALEGSSKWTDKAYANSMKSYAQSNWPKFGQNNFNLHRAITVAPNSLPMGKILSIIKANQED
jgi:outer membrane protein assembly factor BamB